jgi:hypothetical protein
MFFLFIQMGPIISGFTGEQMLGIYFGNFSITLGIAIFLFIKSWTQGLESAIVNS